MKDTLGFNDIYDFRKPKQKQFLMNSKCDYQLYFITNIPNKLGLMFRFMVFWMENPRKSKGAQLQSFFRIKNSFTFLFSPWSSKTYLSCYFEMYKHFPLPQYWFWKWYIVLYFSKYDMFQFFIDLDTLWINGNQYQ